MSNPLTTPEVLRLLEGGNESPLAKRSKEAAMALALTVPHSYGNVEYVVGKGGLVPRKITIPSEVVTRELGPIFDPAHNNDPRPAIVISTE